MTIQPFFESGLEFGPYEEDVFFRIEQSHVYAKIKDDVKIGEFIFLKDKYRIIIIEAKSSSPRPETQPNFEEFISDIRDKMLNSFSLFMACRLRRHGNHAFRLLPRKLGVTNPKKIKFSFILVVNGHKHEWCIPIQEALTLALRPIIKTWNIGANSVAVLNKESAVEYGLVSDASIAD